MSNPLLTIGSYSSVKDREWVRSSFMLATKKWNTGAVNSGMNSEWLYFTSSKYKYTNTSIGGNFTINSLPQFTAFADPPSGAIRAFDNNKDIGLDMTGGMGRYYSEAIDDWSQKVSFRFGLPEYKGLLTFFTSFYDGAAATLGRTGRMPMGLFYTAGKLMGTLIGLPFSVIIWTGEIINFVVGRPSTRYYSVKPTMYLYWNRVNMIANMLAANMGLVPRNNHPNDKNAKYLQGSDLDKDPKKANEIGMDIPETDAGLGAYSWTQLQGQYSELFLPKGGIDVFYLSTKSQRMHNQFIKETKAKLENASAFDESLKTDLDNYMAAFTFKDPLVPGVSLDEALKRYHNSNMGSTSVKMADGTTYDPTQSDIVMNSVQKQMQAKMAGQASPTGSVPTQPTDVTKQQTTQGQATPSGDGTQSAPTEASGGDATANSVTTSTTPQNTTDLSQTPASDLGQNLVNNSSHDNLIWSVIKEIDEAAATTDSTTTASSGGVATGGQTLATNVKNATTGTAVSNPADGVAPTKPADGAKDIAGTTDASASGGSSNKLLDAAYELLPGWGKGFIDYETANFQDGGQWINFRVDKVASVSETFTNNTGPSEIQGRINGASANVAEMRFSLSDFQTGFSGLDMITNGIRDTFAGVADGMHISGLAALMGAGYVDIPDRYTDSQAQFPTSQFTIKCRPVYGNVLSRFLNMHVIIACVLAGGLPISYGRHAYGAPFICEFYMRGKTQSRLAIIDSITITRGEGNLGWNQQGDFLGCDITFSVKDLSHVMHAPIDSGFDSLFNLRYLIADDNPFNDYMAVLSNLSTGDMTYSWEKLKINWQKHQVLSGSFFSAGRAASWFADTTPGRIIRKFNYSGQNYSVK